LPPLRERKEDIPQLVDHFLNKFAADTGGTARSLAPKALDKITAYHWPGNVRELENIIERSMVLSSKDVIQADDIHLDPRTISTAASDDIPFLPDGMSMEEYEQELIREALRRTNDNKSQAARLLGLTRNALRYRLSQMGVDTPQ